MTHSCILWIFIGICIGSVTGQVAEWLYKDEVYVYSTYPKDYNYGVEQCVLFGTSLATLNDLSSEFVRNRSIKIRAGRKIFDVWIASNRSSENVCNIINLKTGQTNSVNCTHERPYICKGPAWRNLTTYENGDKYGFSNVKLRYSAAIRVCEAKAKEYNRTGGLVTVTSSKLKKFLTTFTADTNHGYLISLDNNDTSKTNGYTNWVHEKSPPQDDDPCIQMKPNGRWDNGPCYGYMHFICEWKQDEVKTTQADLPTTTEMTTEQTVTTTEETLTKMETTTTVKAPTTEATRTTTVSDTTTSGGGKLQISTFMSVFLVSFAHFVI